MPQNNNQTQIITVKEVAAIIGLSAAYIRNEIRKHPTEFPPVLKGRRYSRLRFRAADVQTWINTQETQKRAVRTTAISGGAV